MASGLWGGRFVGSTILIDQPSPERSNGTYDWNTIPQCWSDIRFDAIDVLFISLSFVELDDFSFIHNYMGESADATNASLRNRFEWVVSRARSRNPDIKIIVQQQYLTGTPDAEHRMAKKDLTKMQNFSQSAAKFIRDWYRRTLPILGGKVISARIDGFDILHGMCSGVPELLKAMREALDKLPRELGSSPFSLSYSTGVPEEMDKSVASSCDYINLQYYEVRRHSSPGSCRKAFPHLRPEQIVWGFSSEEPWQNAAKTFPEMKQKMIELLRANANGIHTWRINSDVYGYENIFQVWLHNLVHETELPDSKDESIVEKYWSTGGRVGNRDGNPILPQQLT
ncbi:hypothetical protein E8E14_008819 [Neopestalotiopsis sp. 37M]|nr:hypothetical protein E8E14_008819 [Neopestalotiopsis sp. 37M]